MIVTSGIVTTSTAVARWAVTVTCGIDEIGAGALAGWRVPSISDPIAAEPPARRLKVRNGGEDVVGHDGLPG